MARRRGNVPSVDATPGTLWSRDEWKATAHARRDRADAILARLWSALSAVVVGDEPVIAGPWVGEVGYELLGWIPFLRRLLRVHPTLRNRMIVVSRGNTSSWYADLGVRYEEAFKYVSQEELAAIRDSTAHAKVTTKSFRAGPVETHIARAVAAALGFDRYSVVDPSWYFGAMLMLKADGSWSRIDDMGDIAPLPIREVPPAPVGLPQEFVGVRFYSSGVLPASAGLVCAAQQVVDRIGAEYRVIDLDPRLRIDDHSGFGLRGVESLSSFVGAVPVEENLALQTAVLARARSFVGTFGGGSFLAPLLGVPTVSVFAQMRIIRHFHFITTAERFGTGGYGAWYPVPFDASGASARSVADLALGLARGRADSAD